MISGESNKWRGRVVKAQNRLKSNANHEHFPLDSQELSSPSSPHSANSYLASSEEKYLTL